MNEARFLKFKPAIAGSPIYRGGRSAEALQGQVEAEAVAKLSSNENPLPTSPQVVEALQGALTELNRYPSMGDDDLRAGLAAYNGRGTTADHYVTGNGGCDVLRLIAEGFLNPGDEAIICPPTFPVYELMIKRVGATPIVAPLTADYCHDIPRILAAVTEKTRLVFICSPNNPTGSTVSQGEFDRLLDGLPEDVVLVTDEVYHHFTTTPDYADSFRHLDRNVIIVHSFSKVFGLAGLRLGYGIARPEIARYLSRARNPFHLNHLTMLAAEVALQDRDYLEETISLVVGERKRMAGRLAGIDGVTVWPSQANFFLFQTQQPAAEVAARLERRGSIVRELGGFYMPGFMRVSIGLPEENEQFIANLVDVLAGFS